MIETDKRTIIEELSKDLKLTPPDWAGYVKTGHGKQRTPVRQDWWQVRAASLLLKIKDLGPIGTNKLSVKYGTRKNRGMMPEKFTRGSRNLIRKILQQLESQELIEQATIGVHKGRILTKKGNKLVNEASKKVAKKK